MVEMVLIKEVEEFFINDPFLLMLDMACILVLTASIGNMIECSMMPAKAPAAN